MDFSATLDLDEAFFLFLILVLILFIFYLNWKLGSTLNIMAPMFEEFFVVLSLSVNQKLSNFDRSIII